MYRIGIGVFVGLCLLFSPAEADEKRGNKKKKPSPTQKAPIQKAPIQKAPIQKAPIQKAPIGKPGASKVMRSRYGSSPDSAAGKSAANTEKTTLKGGTAGVSAEVVPAPPPVREGVLVADNFDTGKTIGVYSGRLNTLGAYHSTFAKRPAYALMVKNSKVRRGNTGSSLQIDYQNRGSGWAGYYNIFGGISTRDYNVISFWVKGKKGGETFDIGFVDESMNNLQFEAVYVGSVQLYLASGITKDWQQVVIPFCAFDSVGGGYIDVERVDGIVFNARNRQKSTIFLEDIEFSREDKIDHDYYCLERKNINPVIPLRSKSSVEKNPINRPAAGKGRAPKQKGKTSEK